MEMLNKYQFTKLVGKKIKELREKSGLSQEALSDKAGLYRTYVGHIEVGRYSPSAYTVYKIAKALNVTASEFYPQ